MKKIITFLLASAPLFGGDLQLILRRPMPNTLEVEALYQGEDQEIGLPPRVRLISFKNEDTDRFTAQGRLALRVKDGSSFTYRITLPAGHEYGTFVERWFPDPLDQNITNNYQLTDQESGTVLFPYGSRQERGYQFQSIHKPRLAVGRFTVLSEEGSPRVTLIHSRPVAASPDEIRSYYQHYVSIFGDRGFEEIIVIAAPRLLEGALWAEKNLFLLMPQAGTLPQFARLIPEAWALPEISPRLFAFFKDAVLRFRPFHMPADGQGSYVTDPLWTKPAASVEYYKGLFSQGIEGAMVDVQAEMLLDNNSLLNLADTHLGLDVFFSGIKDLFQNPTITNEGADYERLNWNALLNKGAMDSNFVQFFTKEAFRPDFEALLAADAFAVSRNSDYIPNFNIVKEGGENIIIDWDGRRAVPMPVTSGTLTLDSERKVPRLNYIDSTYTFDRREQLIRSRIMTRVSSLKFPSVEAFRRHIDLQSFPAPEGNPYEIEAGRPVYISVSLVLSTGTGSLKPAIQEAFFVMDDTLQPMSVAHRLRL